MGQTQGGMLLTGKSEDDYWYWTKYTFSIPALNFTYGSANTVQPSSIQTLIIIKD